MFHLPRVILTVIYAFGLPNTLKSTFVLCGGGSCFTFCHQQGQLRGRVSWAATQGSVLCGTLPSVKCSEVSVLKSFIILEREALRFHFAVGSATSGADFGHRGIGSIMIPYRIEVGRSLVIDLSKPFILKVGKLRPTPEQK